MCFLNDSSCIRVLNAKLLPKATADTHLLVSATPGGHGPPPPSAITAQTGLHPGVWHGTHHTDPIPMVAVTPQMMQPARSSAVGDGETRVQLSIPWRLPVAVLGDPADPQI